MLEATNGIGNAQDPASVNGAPPTRSAGAAEWIAQATDSNTGAVDTRTLAHWVADAQRRDPEAANEAYVELESQLGQRSFADLSRFYADLRGVFSGEPPSSQTANALGNGVFGLGQGLVVAGGREATRGFQLLVNNPILSMRWESSISPITGRGGFTPNLETFLRQNGLEVTPRVNPVAPGSTTPAHLVRTGQAPNLATARGIANNTNGAAAEAAIRSRMAGPGIQVDPNPTAVQGGRRIVDVTAHVANEANPRNAQRIEIESKVGRTNMGTARVRGEVAMDAARLADNQAIRRTGTAVESMGNGLRTAGKIIRPIGIAMDAFAIGSAFHEDGNRIGVNTGRAISTTAGGIAGAAGGASVGAAIGTAIFPGVGTVVGGVVGGIFGGLGGGELASRGFDLVRSWF